MDWLDEKSPHSGFWSHGLFLAFILGLTPSISRCVNDILSTLLQVFTPYPLHSIPQRKERPRHELSQLLLAQAYPTLLGPKLLGLQLISCRLTTPWLFAWTPHQMPGRYAGQHFPPVRSNSEMFLSFSTVCPSHTPFFPQCFTLTVLAALSPLLIYPQSSLREITLMLDVSVSMFPM